MGKAKQKAAARADELLKSYNVKLNPMAGTYRLEDKVSGKEVNVERSGVDVGTSWLASGRRANRLIGKNLVRQGASLNSFTPPTTTEKAGTGTAGNQSVSSTKSIPLAGEKNTTPVMLRGLPKDQPQYQAQLPNISSIWNKRSDTNINSTSNKGIPDQKSNNVIPENNTTLLPKSSYRPLNEYTEGFEVPSYDKYGIRKREPLTNNVNSVSDTAPVTQRPASSNLKTYHEFRFKMLSPHSQTFYGNADVYGKSLPHTETSPEVINYAKQKAVMDLKNSQPTNWERIQNYFGELKAKSNEARQFGVIAGGRTR